MENIKLQLHTELENYLNGKSECLPYYPGMPVLTSPLYKKQLKEVLVGLKKEDMAYAKSFEMYHETIILNMHTKISKYKKSLYFDDENIKNIENQGYNIPFYFDEEKNNYILLGFIGITL